MQTRPARWMIAGVAIAVGVAAQAQPARDQRHAVAQASATPPGGAAAPGVTAPAPATPSTAAPAPRRQGQARTPARTARPPSRAEAAAIAARRARQNAERLQRMARWRVIDVETGDAHWYGPGFHGRRTANGERFDRNALTAAHRDLPLGSYARVTSMRTSRVVIVRINDRHAGPEHAVIDLAQGAAAELGIVGRGASPVRVEVLQPP